MKELLAVISLLVCGVVSEPPAGPYPASGWRPSGPAFQIPQPGQAQQQPALYLPPVDPRNSPNMPQVEYGTPSNSTNIPDLDYGLPEGPFVASSNPNVGFGVPQDPRFAANGPNVGIGFPQGPGISATIPRMSGTGPSVGLGFPQGPSIAASVPNADFGGSPNVGLGIPRGPGISANNPNVGFGVSLDTPADVSVQGLPPQKDEVPYFQPSPVNGVLNVGLGFNADIRNLNQNLQQIQYEQQQQNYREFQRQRQLDALIAANRLQRPEAPAVFASRTTSTTTEMTTPEETTVASTTEVNLNEGESLEMPKKKEKVTVELTAQKIQEYPGEFFLSSLAQVVAAQPQFTPLQFGQLKTPLYVQPLESQKQISGFDAQTHFAALPSVLAQQKLQQQNILIPAQPQDVPELQPVTSYQQPQFQVEQLPIQPQALYNQPNVEPVSQYQPQLQGQPQVQPQPQLQLLPLPQYATKTVQFPQSAQFQPQPSPFQPQTVQLQPQPGQYQPAFLQPQPDNKDTENIDQSSYQPQIYQQQFLAPQLLNQPQAGYVQTPLINYPSQDLSQYQGQFQQQNQFPSPSQGGDALQSGLDVNQQGNDIDEPQDQEEGQDEGTKATAVATAFGTRTQPRVTTTYGVPFPVPRVQASPTDTTTVVPTEDVTDEGPVVAQAVAIADGTRKKSAKLRRNRLRPIFTLDKSGHLVLAQ